MNILRYGLDYINSIPYNDRTRSYALFNRKEGIYIAPIDNEGYIVVNEMYLLRKDENIEMLNGANCLVIDKEGFYYCVDTWDGVQSTINFLVGGF